MADPQMSKSCHSQFRSWPGQRQVSGKTVKFRSVFLYVIHNQRNHMNERIKQLAEQATTIEYGADRGFDRVTFDKEKFAELIVRECALQCVHNEDMDLIEKHFGVEE